MVDTALASRLEGKKIGQWSVLEKRKKDQNDNSGFWSTCYTVINGNGEKAFLKAYNYTYAFGSQSSMDTLKFMTENFVYERDLLSFCTEYKMKRVVTAIDSGEYSEQGEILSVPYLVFEIAQGNLKAIQAKYNPDLAWKLRSFHGALIGLSQLHSMNICHQDIKPSNILVFGKNISKLADLGSATQLGNESKNWTHPGPAGDLRYAPIELLYKYISPNWNIRRFGADLFMIGGVLTYKVCDTNFLALMHSKIPNEYQYKNFGGTYQDAIPFIMDAYDKTIVEVKSEIPAIIREELTQVIAELSHPIPEKRGNPQKIGTRHTQHSLQRYISVIDRLTKKLMW